MTSSGVRGVSAPSDVVTSNMVGIGMNFAAPANYGANIERTLVEASELGMDADDLRVLAVLSQWIGTHHGHINADRLVREIPDDASPRVRAYWAAVAQWLQKDRRFARLSRAYGGEALDLLLVGSDFQIARRGTDERFIHSVLRVPAGTLREREADVLSPAALVRLHTGYRNRVHLGPTWRADVWTVLESEPGLSIAETARRAGSSFATAWQVAQSFALLHEAG